MQATLALHIAALANRLLDPPLPQVLLNHSADDRAYIEPLHRALTERGWKVQGSWQLPASHRVEEYLETVLPSTGCIVTFWTESSLGQHLLKDIAHEANRLGIGLPVLLHDVKPPLALRSQTPLNLIDEPLDRPDSTAINELVDAIESVLVGSGDPQASSGTSEPTLSIRVARRVLEELRRKELVHDDTSNLLEHFKLGDWIVDVGANSLSKGDKTKKIAPRSMEVLAYLTTRSPETVAVQEVLRDVWRDRIVVDSVVHKCIRELRIALDDDYKQPQYIETYPKRGYRVIAKVS